MEIPGHQEAWLPLPWSCLDQNALLWSADAAAFFFRQVRRCCHRHTGNARLVGELEKTRPTSRKPLPTLH